MRTCEKSGCGYPVFGTDKKTGKGFCSSHQYLRTDTDRRTSAQKVIAKIKNDAALKNEDTELSKWYKTKMKKSKRVCENCLKDLSHYNEEDWFGSQHHIFEKSIFHSIKTHPLNHGVLGKWCCHSQWHSSLLNASKMPFFKIAIERFIMFEPDIKERGRIPEIYLQEIKSFY